MCVPFNVEGIPKWNLRRWLMTSTELYRLLFIVMFCLHFRFRDENKHFIALICKGCRAVERVNVFFKSHSFEMQLIFLAYISSRLQLNNSFLVSILIFRRRWRAKINKKPNRVPNIFEIIYFCWIPLLGSDDTNNLKPSIENMFRILYAHKCSSKVEKSVKTPIEDAKRLKSFREEWPLHCFLCIVHSSVCLYECVWTDVCSLFLLLFLWRCTAKNVAPRMIHSWNRIVAQGAIQICARGKRMRVLFSKTNSGDWKIVTRFFSTFTSFK